MKSSVLCAAAVAVMLPHTALAWGGEGHRIVGAIADKLLEAHPSTKNKVSQILGGK